jgi:hypothetical protein
MSLTQVFATDAQPTERRPELSVATPAQAQPPESAGPAPDTTGDAGDAGDDDQQ